MFDRGLFFCNTYPIEAEEIYIMNTHTNINLDIIDIEVILKKIKGERLNEFDKESLLEVQSRLEKIYYKGEE